MLRNLGNDPKIVEPHINVTPNEIAHQLLQNWKCLGIKKVKPKLGPKLIREPKNIADILHTPFTLEELDMAIAWMKEKKVSGLDEIRTKQIKNFGQQTKSWLLEMYNCIKYVKIPTIWINSRLIALLKPGKQPTEVKNFHPISLLCHTYKLLERLILNRINDIVDKSLINEQDGYRGGKSCTGQILNLTQSIENGYERNWWVAQFL